MSDNQLNPDVVASSPAENLVPAQESTPEPNEEVTLTTEQWETSLYEVEEHRTFQTEWPFLIGCVDKVNGESAEEVPAFVPTKHELIQLAKYWWKEVLYIDFSLFLYREIGSTEICRRPFAISRIDRIADALGDDEVRKAVRDVTDKFAQDAPRAERIIFQYGTVEEVAFYHDNNNLDDRGLVTKPGVAEELASKVVDRIFREGTPEQQEKFLKEELRRYSSILHEHWLGGNFIQLFGIGFPCEVKPLVLKTGVDDPDPDPDCNTFFELSLAQGKAILAALNEVASKGEDALKALVQRRSAAA